LTLWSLALFARELVEKFYSLLGQRASKSKRERSMEECLRLLQEGFTPEEIDYAISWLITQHPTTGSFSRLSHFIDQALKERQAIQQTQELRQRQALHATREAAERQQLVEAQHRIDLVKESLSPDRLAELREEAQRLVAQEHPDLPVGQEFLIRLKIDELIRAKYL
jgi:hypothetical protein